MKRNKLPTFLKSQIFFLEIMLSFGQIRTRNTNQEGDTILVHVQCEKFE